MVEAKIFGKWDVSQIKITDPSIKRYVNLSAPLVLHSSGRHAKKPFGKAEVPIVERLINKMMRGEDNTGKKLKAYNIVKKAFEIIDKKTGQNPVAMLIKAIENAGPREETVRLKYGGIMVPKAVDTAPMRRVDQALMFIAQAAEQASFKNKKRIEECLAYEIIAAANYDIKSSAIARKDEKERIAKAAR
ncbi:MAG: 30S ribosomal protein S7 [Methanocellales archaeon]